MKFVKNLTERIKSVAQKMTRKAGSTGKSLPKSFQSLREQVKSGDLIRKIKIPKNLKSFAKETAGSAAKLIKKKDIPFYGVGATILASTYFLADLASVGIDQMLEGMLKTNSAHVQKMRRSKKKLKNIATYDPIINRDLFGVQPKQKEAEVRDPNQPAVRTSLPLKLIGTLVVQDGVHSIATIQDTTVSRVYPVHQDDEIPRKARILKVEPFRVVFTNLQNQRKEFVELPKDFQGAKPVVSTPKKIKGGVEVIEPRRFTISRPESALRY